MRKKVVMVTGAAGELGHALVKELAADESNRVVTLDLQDLPGDIIGASVHVQGDILDRSLLARLISEYEIDIIYHLAALLSTRSEFTPETAHRVNVGGTIELLKLASEQSEWRGQPVMFLFPSSIAVYGLPDLETKSRYEKVREWEWNYPSTMYGCNKLYCEMLGTYFSQHYRQLAADQPVMLDFRALRYPGLISAFTVPSGGTSDFGPEMLHAAAQGESYACFVREDVRIPFMAMPDAVTAMLKLSQAPAEALNHRVYNVTSFSLSAADFRQNVVASFPDAAIEFEPDLKRQGIVDSWPADLDDSSARRDWGWSPAYNKERSFDEYLVPNIRERYQKVERV
jgi:nucleoside-diphosphate-sugar epimerase